MKASLVLLLLIIGIFQAPVQPGVSQLEHPRTRDFKNSARQSTLKRNLGLGLGIGIGGTLLAAFLYIIYHLRKIRQAQAQQELEMVQQTLARRAFIESFPVQVYSLPEEGTDVDECPICLGEYIEGSNLRLLPSCGHLFHTECIDQAWEQVSKPPQCPVCRHLYDTWQPDRAPPV